MGILSIPGPSSLAGKGQQIRLADVPAQEGGGFLGLTPCAAVPKARLPVKRPQPVTHSFTSAARPSSWQALFKQAAWNSWAWLSGACWNPSKDALSAGACLWMCNHANPRTRLTCTEDLLFCSNNSTVYCQSSPDTGSPRLQIKWAVLAMEERSVGWITIKAHSLWADSIQERLSHLSGEWLSSEMVWKIGGVARGGEGIPLLVGSWWSPVLPSSFFRGITWKPERVRDLPTGTQLTGGLGLLLLSTGFLWAIPPITPSPSAHCFEPQVIREPATLQWLFPEASVGDWWSQSWCSVKNWRGCFQYGKGEAEGRLWHKCLALSRLQSGWQPTRLVTHTL